MWLEIAVVVLVLLQAITIGVLWLQGRRLQRGLADRKNESGNVPALMIVNALNKIEHRLSVLEERAQKPVVQAPVRQAETLAASMPSARSASHHLSASNYELAQHLAREGCDVEQLMERCGLSRNEAELVLRLYAKRA
jgi:hypothetical protein